jgi:hypothetical protein
MIRLEKRRIKTMNNETQPIANNKWRIASKACLLLVFIAFFMPVSCDMSGFNLIDMGFKESADNPFFKMGVGLLVVLLSAIVGIALGVILCVKNLPKAIDWIVWCAGALGLLVVRLAAGGDNEWQSGAYCILVGQVLSGIFLCLTPKGAPHIP